MKNNLKLVLASLIILFGCEKEVDLKIDEDESKIVLNAWLKTEQHPLVEINHSTFIFDKRGTDKIENAEVTLFANNKEIGILEHFESGFYENQNLVIKPDTEYKIIAKVAGFEDVSATDKSSVKLTESDYTFAYKIVDNQYGPEYESQSEVNITIKDKAATEDFYLFLVKETSKSWDSKYPEDTTYYKNNAYLESIDSQTEIIYLNTIGPIQLLKDELFNGNSYTARLKTTDLRKKNYSEDDYNTIIQYTVEIHKISKSLYLYFKSLEYNRYPDPFTEPSQIFTNVENGYGIFATSAVVKIPIEETRDDDANQ